MLRYNSPMTHKENSSSQQQIENVPPNPLWWEDMSKKLPSKDRKAFADLREYLRAHGGQRWLYPMSGIDITPIMLAPADTEHTYLDISYTDTAPAYPYGTQLFEEAFQHTFQRLEAPVVTSASWTDALARKRQDIVVDDTTAIHLVGEDIENKEIAEVYDTKFDVIYNNAGMQVTNLLPQLCVGGLYILECPYFPDDDNTQTRKWLVKNEISIGTHHSFPEFQDKTLEDFGLVPTFTTTLHTMGFSQVSKNDLVVPHDPTFFQVFQKTREFTHEELDQLACVQLLQCMEGKSSWYLMAVTENDKQSYLQDYQKIFHEYLKKIKIIYQTSPALAQRVHAFVEQQNFAPQTEGQLLYRNLGSPSRRNTTLEHQFFQELVALYQDEKTQAELPADLL